MQITIDTNNLSDLDINMLAFLAAGTSEETVEEPETVEVPNDEPKKAAPKKVEETPDEDLLGDAPTMADAVAAATALVSNGGAAKVKEALAEVGAKRVSEMKTEDIPAFLAALEA